MTTYTITLTEAEEKALRVVTIDPNDWIQNAVHERCRVAIEEVVQYEVQRRLSSGEPIPSTKEEIVLSSDIETAADRQIRLEEEFKTPMKEQG